MNDRLPRIPLSFFAITAGAIALCWPAFYNRYPLLFPDSLSYISDGALVARALFLHQLSQEYGMRSLIYSLGILPFHWTITPWPIVALHAVITALMLWLVVRSILPRNPAPYYLAIVLALSTLTSTSWYVSLIMPDILGPALYLAIYLLVFARETLSNPERIAVSIIACWAVASHATHLMLGGLICAALIVLLAFKPLRHRIRGIAEVAAILLIAAFAQIALNAYLYSQSVLDSRRPPYLMARVLGDGTGRDYLQQHCSQLKWVICDSVQNLPHTDDEFLWAEGSIWSTATAEKQQELRREEMPLVLATILAYPRQQFAKSLDNSWQQLTNFDVNDFDSNTWMDASLDEVLPGAKTPYSRSLQSRSALPEDRFSTIHYWTVVVSLLIVLASLPFLWSNIRLRSLALIVLPVVLANGVLTAVLSDLDGRYQSRVVWLIPLLAALMLAHHISLARQRKAVPLSEAIKAPTARLIPA
jgi:hypothetical protein